MPIARWLDWEGERSDGKDEDESLTTIYVGRKRNFSLNGIERDVEW
jgi:hypothetical protein